jgi:hypothetical protein
MDNVNEETKVTILWTEMHLEEKEKKKKIDTLALKWFKIRIQFWRFWKSSSILCLEDMAQG